MAQLGCYSQICTCAARTPVASLPTSAPGPGLTLLQYRRIAAAADGHSRGTHGVLRRAPSVSASACIGKVCALPIRSLVAYEALALASAITLQHEALAARTAATVSASGAVPAACWAYWRTGRRIAALPARSHLEGSQCGGTRVTSSRRPRFCQWPLRARPRRTANHGPAAKGRADSDGQAAAGVKKCAVG